VSKLQEIEQAIDELPRLQFLELVRHIRDKHGDDWDRQIEADANAGCLDGLWAEAEKEIAQGKAKPLNELLND
jgi:hypothetical protein